MLTRRRLLQSGAAGLAGLAMPLGLGRTARAATGDPVLVVLFLRGGADGLHMVIPTLDPAYYDLRPTLQVPDGSELPLTPAFGMHPAMAEMRNQFHQGQLDVIHAVGIPDDTRSHFDAQDYIERPTPAGVSSTQGWLNKTLEVIGGGDPLAGVTVGAEKDLALQGPAQSLQLRSVLSFRLSGTPVTNRREALGRLYASQPGSLLANRAEETFDVLDRMETVSLDNNASYPGTDLAVQLVQVASLIKANIGVRVVTTSAHHWDTHDRQSETSYVPMRDLSLSLAAFQQHLGTDAARVVTLVVTEFGRTAGENGAQGTDHGRGSAMFALGGSIRGGRVLLRDNAWPGLSDADPYRDLPVTTDFRDVFAEVLERHLGAPDVGAILPGFDADPSRFPGILA